MRYLAFLLATMVLLSCKKKEETTTTVPAPAVQPDQVVDQTTDADSTGFKYSFGYDPVVSLAKAEADNIPSDTSQILSFGQPGAIPIYPDTVKLNELQKDEDLYNTVLDDYLYYESLALDTLRSRSIFIHNGGIVYRKYYKFKFPNNRDFYVDMFKIRDWGIILYNGKDVPLFVSPTYVADVMDSVFDN